MRKLASIEPTAGSGLSTLGEAVGRTRVRLQRAGIKAAALDARLIAAEACDLLPEEVIIRRDLMLSPADIARMAEFEARRLSGEPISGILGRREFWGLTFRTSRATLDPRPESELLVEAVLDYARRQRLLKAPLRVLDLGTGSGCLLGAILSELTMAYGVGLDRSLDALEIARQNLSRMGLLRRATLLCSDWLMALRQRSFDIIVCNPPYIPSSEIEELAAEVRDHDPHLALDGGSDGLEAYRLISRQALQVLRGPGFLVFETGYGQAEEVRDLMVEASRDFDGFETEILMDLSGIGRAVAGVRQSKHSELDPKKKIGNPVLSG